MVPVPLSNQILESGSESMLTSPSGGAVAFDEEDVRPFDGCHQDLRLASNFLTRNGFQLSGGLDQSFMFIFF